MLLEEEFEGLKKEEAGLMTQIEQTSRENEIHDTKANQLDLKYHNSPEKQLQMNDKIENLNNVLKSKDEVIDQILTEISSTKNEKDEL